MLRRLLDAAVGAASRFVLGVFFRSVEVVGRDRLPRPPRIVVANHVNGLIDPLFVFGTLRLPARTLGKSTLWRIPILRRLLDLAGVIPVYRPQDEGADPARNRETFARSVEELAGGATIAIFPEGISHDQPRLQPLRTGAARIAIEAELERGPLGVAIVPVGLVFEERTLFRSRALVVVGEPLDPEPEVDLARTDELGAARALTARIAAALERVTLNYRSWEEARWIETGAAIFERQGLELPRARRLAAEFEVRRSLAAGLEALRERHPEEVAAAVEAIRDYDRLLATCGLRDEQVVARYPIGPTLYFVLRSLARMLLAAPIAAAGTLANALPYLAVRAVAARAAGGEPNQVATYKVFPSLVAYPSTWGLEAALSGWLAGGWAALATLVAAPFAGLVAIRFLERSGNLWRETRAYLLLRRRRKIAGELRARRGEVERRTSVLVERWRELQPDGDSSSRA